MSRRSAGAWVLAIGAARYAFLAAAWPLPWMRDAAAAALLAQVRRCDAGGRAHDRGRRRAGAGRQPRGSRSRPSRCSPSRSSATCGGCGPTASRAARARRSLTPRHPSPSHPGAPPAARRGPVRTGVATALTILAVAIVWAALVFPDRPSTLTLIAFLRVPLEGLVLVALALVLPVRPRRVLAGLLGVAPRPRRHLEGARHRLLHGLRTAVRPARRRHRLRLDRHRNARLHGRSHGGQTDRRRRRRGRRRAACWRRPCRCCG